MTWFLVMFLSCASAPTCPASPRPVFIQMPDQATCQQVQALNRDAAVSIECWAKPTAKKGD